MSILDDLRSLLNAPADTARAREALSAAMTSHIIPMQPPTMTTAHVATLRTVIQLWPYPFAAERTMLTEILHHLDALLQAPVPTRGSGNAGEVLALVDKWLADPEPDPPFTPPPPLVFDDWSPTYAPLDMEVYQSDQ